jgi:Flp pilus assembly protein TadG
MKVNGKTRTSLAEGRCSPVEDRLGILKSPSGQSLLEVALLTPMLLALLLGAIELGRYAYISILVGNAARAGAAYGAQNLILSQDIPGIQTAAKNDFQYNGQNISQLSVNPVVTSCGCDTNGTIAPAPSCSTATNPTASICASGHWVVMVSVTASGTFNSLFNYPGIPSQLIVSNTATLRVAQT